eukprot:109008-Hanusia_phi.AAC.2
MISQPSGQSAGGAVVELPVRMEATRQRAQVIAPRFHLQLITTRKQRQHGVSFPPPEIEDDQETNFVRHVEVDPIQTHGPTTCQEASGMLGERVFPRVPMAMN